MNKDEIAARLKGVPKDKCVAFAVRSAMRVLPLLAVPKKKDLTQTIFRYESEAFWCWDNKDRNKYLLAVFRTFGFCIEYVLTKEYANYDDFVDAVHAHNAASNSVKAAADETASALVAEETIVAAIAAVTTATEKLLNKPILSILLQPQPIILLSKQH